MDYDGPYGLRGNGGGIYSGRDGTLTLTHSTVSGNTATRFGGGIVNNRYPDRVFQHRLGQFGGRFWGGDLQRRHCNPDQQHRSTNSAGDGGGISIPASGTLTLTNSTVEGNSAQSRGGGIFNAHGSDYQGTHYAGMVTLTNSAVSGNTAGTRGGGVSNGDLLTLTNSTVSGNTVADRGGGLDNAGTVTLTNSTVASNTATDRAGGMENSGTVTFTNSTVAGNVSGRVAGGLFNTGTVTLVQSLLSGNTAPVNGPEAYSVAGQGTVHRRWLQRHRA